MASRHGKPRRCVPLCVPVATVRGGEVVPSSVASVAARGASGCDDLLILHGRCDGAGDLGVQRGAQFVQVQVAVDPAKLFAGLDHADGDHQRSAMVKPAGVVCDGYA